MKEASLISLEGYADVPLPYSEETVEKFAKGMGFDVDKQCYESKEAQVDDRQFGLQGNGDAALADVSPILYYSGHGSQEGPEFFSGDAASPNEMAMGDKLVIAAFDCCQMLSNCTPWESAFRGLRYMLGFAGSPGQSTERGEYFAYRLKEKLPISEAWRQATLESGAFSGSSLRAFLSDDPEEIAWPHLNPLPAGKYQFSCLIGSAEKSVATFSEISSLGHEVPLFASPDRSSDRLHAETFEKYFGLKGHEFLHEYGARQVLSPNASLEIFDESLSFWWNRKIAGPARSRRGISPGPFPIGKIVNITPLLLQHVGLKDYRFSDPWESFTTAIEENQAGSSSVAFRVARHVEFPLTLGGFPLFGPGACFRASVHECELSEVLFFSRAAMKSGVVPIMCLNEAEELLMKDPSLSTCSGVVRVLRRSFGYYLLPPRKPQDHLVPVYAFEGVVINAPRARYDFVRYVQAIPQERRNEFADNSVVRRLPPVFP